MRYYHHFLFEICRMKYHFYLLAYKKKIKEIKYNSTFIPVKRKIQIWKRLEMDLFRRMKKMIEANDLKSFRGNPAILLKAICQLRAKAVPWKALQVHTFFPSRAKVSKKNRRLNRSCEDGGRAATYRKVDRSTHRFAG